MANSWCSGSPFEKEAGYDRVFVKGNFVFVAGTTGFDYQTMAIKNDLESQVRQSLENVRYALSAVNSSFADLVRVRWIITDRKYFVPAGNIIRDTFFPVRPPATTIISQLVDPRMLFEIECTAMI